jgi:hypothetical protein
MKTRNKLFLILLFTIALFPCNTDDEQEIFDKVEVIIVNKIPRGVFAGENMPENFQNLGWYDIGLSTNGQEPIEYIWRAFSWNIDNDFVIMSSKIGDKGIIHLGSWGRLHNIKLPIPNAEKPPIIGLYREVWWEKYCEPSLSSIFERLRIIKFNSKGNCENVLDTKKKNKNSQKEIS